MKTTERRLRALEVAANIAPSKPWKSVIVGIGETAEEVLAREGIEDDDNVIVTVIVEPGGEIPEAGMFRERTRT